ncbi:hypothetical protein N7447_001943 [Penicillium robsamsonii]|uniref:uncharacterized protein n=1 Tax=Penicillium robsamsonii TaxID=1792511 RepID=UPI0025471CFD|nr:uncharacterized protein N7447_001943 [Penicillium robsamsonii]KAJ5835917.1 hypothetical protein N7447_001943 [Penicillium robsamsonii]
MYDDKFHVAEYTLGLVISLQRKIHKAWLRVREDKFSLNSLVGSDLYGRNIGVVGTGNIGVLVGRERPTKPWVWPHDVVEYPDLVSIGVKYVGKDEPLHHADVVSLHCPLLPDTQHLIDAGSLKTTKPGVVIVNSGRSLVDSTALLDGLESGHVGGAALDVYEKENPLFFRDSSEKIVRDHTFQRLITLPNVIVTGNQVFLSREALESIANIMLSNIAQFEKNDGHVERAT